MEKHFNFGHTLIPKEQQQDSSDDLINLFKIGDQQIDLQKNESKEGSDHGSDQTAKQKKIKKEKKQKKQKKEKKEKKESKHKQKKDKTKKQKKDKKRKKSHSQQSNQSFANQPLQVYGKAKKMELYEKYSKVINQKPIDEILTHKFELNVKLGQGILNVDIIRFPEHRLYQYGPMDKEIPRYQRLPNFEKVIGFQRQKRIKAIKIIRELNKIINQKNINPNQDEISTNRYFDYQGYENTGFQKLATEKKLFTSESLLKFNLTQAPSASEEDNVLRITKQFNRRINQNNKDIKLWLEFINIQDTFSLSIGSLKNKGAVIDRKISILQKSLQFNPYNQKLGIIYLGLFFQKQHDHKELSKKCLEFIRYNPSSIQLWKFYFNLNIEQFSSFSHPYIRKVFEEMNDLFKKTIEKTKSAIEIWKIRKASLQILKSMLQIYKLQGYNELSTGIIVALIEYNIFMPDEGVKLNRTEEKLHLFLKYWENYSVFKLGETTSNSNWSNIVPYSEAEDHQFIGSLKGASNSKERNSIMKQMIQSQNIWRMANAIKDQQTIQKWPDSFILLEDIDFALMLYRDNESFMTLLDILADQLQLPLVFSATNIYNQFNFKIIEGVLRRIIKKNNFRVQGLNYKRYCYFWTKFWNPQFTQFIIPEHNIIKVQYFRRVLVAVKEKLPLHRTIINQYLSFLTCSIYLSPKIQKSLNISEEKSMQLLSDIMKQQPLNLATWCMYIQATFAKKKNQEQCLQCFLQLFQTIKLLITNYQQQKRISFQLLFWLTQFARLHKIEIGSPLLKMYKRYVFDEQNQITQLRDKINSFDCLLLQQYFIDQLDKILEKKMTKNPKQSEIFQYRNIFFLLFYLEQFPFSELTVLKDKISQFLIEELIAIHVTNAQFFLLRILTSYKLLTPQHIVKYELLTDFPYFILIQYWISSFQKPFLLFEGQFQSLRGKNLALWMTSCVFLWRSRIKHDHFYQFFYTHSKKICFQDKLNDQHPQYITLLNELLVYDVNENHNQFIMYSLHHVAFSKKLYLLNLLLASTPAEKKRLVALIHEKSIRILDQSILS